MKIYYFTKALVALPCLGMLPIGIYFMCLNPQNLAIKICLLMAYVWIVFRYASPSINPAFIKSAGSPRRFFWVNCIIAIVFSAVLLIVGMCLWPVLSAFSMWLVKDQLDITPSNEFLWVYFVANSLFHISYILLWEYIERHRLIRKLTNPNICW